MQHSSLASGRWAELSFSQQMANVGSEVSRTKNWLIKGNELQAERAFERCLELLFLTIKFANRTAIYREICRFKEFFCKAYVEKNIEELAYFDRYCSRFALCRL
ncbi:MAG: hypothetical protein LBU90_09665 [Bacteroidales bacterium]|jgi:hypothetical protein|nr:hypothetical protein [Bacteroidales bacterium]